MSGSRTKTGCYSCRIRKKKCDEAKPHCLACLSRGIDCLGYDVKPAWMIGMGSWQEILKSDKTKAIRKSAERAYSLRRARQSYAIKERIQDALATLPSRKSDASSYHVVHRSVGTLKGRNSIGAASQSMADLLCESSATMDSIWWDSNMSSMNGSPTFNFRNVMHFLEVICPLQYGFSSLRYHPNYQDHRWIINCLVEDEPLYHAASGLSFCLESGRQDGNTSGFCNASADVRKMQVRAIQGLQLRVNELATERQRCATPPIGLASRVLAIILHLLSLEIFNSIGGEWEMHLNAARTILGLFQKPWLSRMPGLPIVQPEIDSIRDVLVNPISTEERKSLQFFVTAFVWTDIMASASNGKSAPKITDFDYTSLLHERVIDPGRIMGCHSTIMTAICSISALEAWKDESYKGVTLDWTQLLERALGIESMIESYLQEAVDSRIYPLLGSANADSKAVTVIYSYAALVYLHLVTSEDPTRKCKMRESTRRCLEKLETLPAVLFIRVCWPFAVAGCMADEGDQDRFRALVARVIAERQVLGFTWKALIVMEECWRLRREQGGNWCWRTTMKHMGLRVLFI
ncbi:fungal-specific transcription factor domain-containing protein [Xylariaceae sp. FL1651]|nr:fungal-specific transcription factor domain-containing protein [Xylariaceae sp. FL1651]